MWNLGFVEKCWLGLEVWMDNMKVIRVIFFINR